MDIIAKNPYRQLGVYANSPVKERIANHNRLKAFLKIGKEVDFPLDLPQFLPSVGRTAETVAQAEASLTLPNEQIRYAQFWFIKVTPLDGIAFNHLFSGDIETAVDFWMKKENASSLQNRIVCALIKGDYNVVIPIAEKLYGVYANDFVRTVLGEDVAAFSPENLAHDFLDKLCEELEANRILSYVSNPNWKKYLIEKEIVPLLNTLQTKINTAKDVGRNDSDARLEAGRKLMNETKGLLSQLRQCLSDTDLRYQTIADKLGLEILQCGIDYFNNSDEPDAAHKAMELQKYAQSVVIGSMAKSRCKDNIDILAKIIRELPPKEVFEEDRGIRKLLRQYQQQPKNIANAVRLLNNTKPYLQSAKNKLWLCDAYSYYLKTSTLIVSVALHTVIEEVNAAQENAPFAYLLPTSVGLIKPILQTAWNAIRIMDTFDMEPDFKKNMYDKNRRILKDLCRQVGIYEGASNTPTSPVSPPPTTAPTTSNVGCFVKSAVVLAGGIIGACIAEDIDRGSGIVGCAMGCFIAYLFLQILIGFFSD